MQCCVITSNLLQPGLANGLNQSTPVPAGRYASSARTLGYADSTANLSLLVLFKSMRRGCAACKPCPGKRENYRSPCLGTPSPKPWRHPPSGHNTIPPLRPMHLLSGAAMFRFVDVNSPVPWTRGTQPQETSGSGRSSPITQLSPLCIEPQLRAIRRRRTALAVVFLVLPIALLVYLYSPWRLVVRNTVVLSWVAIYSFLMLRVAWSRCPCCRGLCFLSKPYFRVNPLRSRCGGCNCSLSSQG